MSPHQRRPRVAEARGTVAHAIRAVAMRPADHEVMVGQGGERAEEQQTARGVDEALNRIWGAAMGEEL